jgi:hypothetical protein
VRDKKIILVGAASMMARAMAMDHKIAGETVIEIKKPPALDMGFPDWETNRAQRRRYGSKRKNLKGLRP